MFHNAFSTQLPMHAFLIIGHPKFTQRKVEELIENLRLKTFNYTIKKIEDVRSLNNFTSLTLDEPTAIVVQSVEEATDEALNAFLKNLEEPQENLYFILTSGNVHSVLATIVSRCQVIRAGGASSVSDERTDDFIGLSTPEKFLYVDKMRKRDEAVSFLEESILTYHQKLQSSDANYSLLAKYLTVFGQTLNAVQGNGNINLQLTNMVLGLV